LRFPRRWLWWLSSSGNDNHQELLWLYSSTLQFCTQNKSPVVRLGLRSNRLVEQVCVGPSSGGETAVRWCLKQEIYCTQDVHSVTAGWCVRPLAMADFWMHRYSRLMLKAFRNGWFLNAQVPSSLTELCGRTESDLVMPFV
jgi:hypothetical protein